MRETAEALGKSLLTVRSWIEKEFIPAPVCRESQQGYLQYVRCEVDAMASVLSANAKHSKYISSKDVTIINRLFEAVWDARREHLGYE